MTEEASLNLSPTQCVERALELVDEGWTLSLPFGQALAEEVRALRRCIAYAAAVPITLVRNDNGYARIRDIQDRLTLGTAPPANPADARMAELTANLRAVIAQWREPIGSSLCGPAKAKCASEIEEELLGYG
jgi:hypothetical protein